MPEGLLCEEDDLATVCLLGEDDLTCDEDDCLVTVCLLLDDDVLDCTEVLLCEVGLS